MLVLQRRNDATMVSVLIIDLPALMLTTLVAALAAEFEELVDPCASEYSVLGMSNSPR